MREWENKGIREKEGDSRRMLVAGGRQERLQRFAEDRNKLFKESRAAVRKLEGCRVTRARTPHKPACSTDMRTDFFRRFS